MKHPALKAAQTSRDNNFRAIPSVFVRTAIMLATSLRQLRSATATRALLTQSAQSLGGVASFSADAQPSDPKTVLAILYKAGAAAEEKRLLGRFDSGRSMCRRCMPARACVHGAQRPQQAVFFLV